jgi:light-regulated signal transduction histidine kinase (bacteriophytochrome)
MGQLIDDMLKLSRMARADLNLKPVDLSAFAQVALDELRRGEPSRQVTSTIQPALIAVADPVLIRSALDNLLQNAWKFTGRRSEARIEIGAADQGGERVFFVRDNGVGFDMTYARKLFGAFQRLHASEDFPGTGIGLATVQRIVHRHGGRIWAEAEPDAGATFFFTLGATAPHESASHPAR